MPIIEIDGEVGRRKTAVKYFLSLIGRDGGEKMTIVMSKMSAADYRYSIRLACAGENLASELREALELKVTVPRIQQVIRAPIHLGYRKIITKPSMTAT